MEGKKYLKKFDINKSLDWIIEDCIKFGARYLEFWFLSVQLARNAEKL